MIKTFLCVLFAGWMFAGNAWAWDGYDYDSNSFITIERGNLVREGREIEVYDYGDNEYKNMEVESVRRIGDRVTIEAYDYESGEHRELEMDMQR